MNKNIDNISNVLQEEIKEEAYPEIQQSYEQLKKSANVFLNIVSQAYESNKYLNLVGGDKEIARIWNAKYDQKTARTLAIAQTNFSNALDKYLDRKILLTLVTSKGDLRLFNEDAEVDILSHIVSDEGRNKFNPSYWNKARQIKFLPATLKTGESIDLINWIKKSVSSKKEVYAKGVDRYEEMLKSKKWSRRFYWWYSNRRGFPKEGFSKGQMAEGYANIVIENNSNFDNNTPETSLKYLYDNYIYHKKESIEAVKKGDIQIDKKGSLSLAIKYENASTARIGQYISVAYHISTSSLLSKESLNKWIQKIPKIHNFVKQFENESEEILFEDVLKNHLSNIKIDMK